MSKARKRSKKSSSLDGPRSAVVQSSEQSPRTETLSLSTIEAVSSFVNSPVLKGKRRILVPRIYLDIIKPTTDNLHITVKAARHLFDENSNGVDSYVRIHIAGLPPESDWVTYTRINDANPVFNESYTISMLDTTGMTHLQVSVWRVSDNAHHCMGCMAFPFYTLNVMNKRLLGWFELLDTTLGQTAYRPFISLDCRVSKNSEVGEMAEMQLSSNAETMEVNRRRAIIDLVNYMRRYLISLINKYKIYCKCLKNYISQAHYNALFNNLELVIQTQINMFDYVKHCYNGRYAVGSVLRSWVPELVCLIDYQRHREHCVRMIQELEHSGCPDVLEIIKDKYKEYTVLLSMPLNHLKHLAKYIRNIQYYTLDKHPDHTNITWVQQYLYWLIVQVECPQRIFHNHSLNHSTRIIDRSFTFSMPEDYSDEDGYLKPSQDIEDLDVVEYDLGEISSLPDSPEQSEAPSEKGQEVRGDEERIQEEEEEEFEWPVIPPEELEIDNEMLLTNQRTASLAKTLDQVIEVFASVSRKKSPSLDPFPLPDNSNWKTIQKLVLPADHVAVEDPKFTSELELNRLTGSSGEDELEEDEGVLHISMNQTEPYYYQTSLNCFNGRRPSKGSMNLSGTEDDTGLDVDIISLENSPKTPNTFKYQPLTSTSSDQTPPSTKRSNHSLHSQKSVSKTGNSTKKSEDPVRYFRSKSEVVPCGVPKNRTPDLSIRKIYVVKSLNDIVFSEEDYDIAAV